MATTIVLILIVAASVLFKDEAIRRKKSYFALWRARER